MKSNSNVVYLNTKRKANSNYLYIKHKLKERLLEIPINQSGLREVYSLSEDLNIEPKEIKPILNELCEMGILIKKTQYICSTCKTTFILTDELLEELVEEDYFECDECFSAVYPKDNQTGYFYFDITDKQLLINW